MSDGGILLEDVKTARAAARGGKTMRDPILKSRTITENGHQRLVRAEGGLNYIRGNSAPYFSLTMSSWILHENGRKTEDCFGAAHEELVRLWPDLADLAALHLSSIDGVPMYAETNGFYHLAGAILPDHAGERYHVGNSERHFPLPEDRRDPTKPWITTEHRRPTPAESLQLFADDWRLSLAEAREILAAVEAMTGTSHAERYANMKAKLAEIAAGMRPRWKAEAEACIKAHNLKVYGDPWQEAVNA